MKALWSVARAAADVMFPTNLVRIVFRLRRGGVVERDGRRRRRDCRQHDEEKERALESETERPQHPRRRGGIDRGGDYLHRKPFCRFGDSDELRLFPYTER